MLTYRKKLLKYPDGLISFLPAPSMQTSEGDSCSHCPQALITPDQRFFFLFFFFYYSFESPCFKPHLLSQLDVLEAPPLSGNLNS